MTAPGTLVLGWGNPGRRDDGIGPAVVAWIGLADLAVDCLVDYQLQIEHAADIADYERVIFVDASLKGPSPFGLQRLESPTTFTLPGSHSLSPGVVLAMSREMYGARPEAWLLSVRGDSFEFREGLTDRGRQRALEAVARLSEMLAAGSLDELPAPARSASTGDGPPAKQEVVR